MTLKHNPGPWIHDCSEIIDGKGWIHDHSEIIDGRGSRVCRFADYGAPSPEDMSVILAAPDMLRLLRVLVPMSESGAEDSKELRKWNAALKEASELIAKLDGDT